MPGTGDDQPQSIAQSALVGTDGKPLQLTSLFSADVRRTLATTNGASYFRQPSAPTIPAQNSQASDKPES